MKEEALKAVDVSGATEEILRLIQRNPNNNNNIYFDGWNGFGATTVLRSIAQALPSMKDPPPELCFDRTIYIDCSRWESKRVMQRRIAEALKLDQKIMAMFDKQDEEDDFNGVEHASRDVLRQVSALIDQTLRQSRFIIFFLNGSQDEVLFSEFGIPEFHCTIIWTFRRMFVAMHEAQDIFKLAENLRRTFGLFIYTRAKPPSLSDSQLNALFHDEAANIAARYPFIMRNIDLTMVTDCCCYGFFLHCKSHNTIGLEWAAHGPNFWICDGIIPKGDRTWEIISTLDSEINFNGDNSLLSTTFDKMTKHSESSHLLVEGEDDGNIDKYEKRPYRWISVTSKNKIFKDNMQTILATASSIFLSFDKTVSVPRLPNTLFKQCCKLGVLILSYCAFSFVSPPFLHCNTLRFLGLGNCTHQNNTSELEEGVCINKWTFLHTLWVLDLRYTDWGEILSEENIAFMTNLIELNIQGVSRSLQYMGQLLQRRLPHLKRLRIIKPTHQEETSIDLDTSFVDKKQLEILDLSSNSDMQSLPTSLSEASKLQVLVLDGCYGLEHVVLASPSLRSFSFDGYGPASNWTSTGKLPPMSSRPECPPSADKKDAKASKISLEGCTMLEDLFLRGLPNLEELDLSGCPIKVLDFGAMVVEAPRLKRLFLLGCENLRAIKWGSNKNQSNFLELICIDTRPRVGCARPFSLCSQQKSFQRQVYAFFADARLARSLLEPIRSAHPNAYFNISITSTATCMETIQPEATTNKEMGTVSIHHQRHCDIAAKGLYCDIFTKVGDGLAPMQAFPQGPMGQLDCHIEIGDGSHSVQSEVEADPYDSDNLASMMKQYAQSLHVHDVSTYCNIMPATPLYKLRWCRIERCPNLHAIFPPDTADLNGKLETIWASDLLMARCVWSKGNIGYSAYHFRSLRHLHLRCCPSLQFGLAMGERPSFPSLETLHIIHCGNLRHIFVTGDKKYQHTSVMFPKLTTIHLHDLPALQQICEAAEMLAPALKTIKIRGCWSLRRLPALESLRGRMRRPTVEIEKDVWDALEWDRVVAGHHPSLYEAPVHSRYYKRRTLRTTVLR